MQWNRIGKVALVPAVAVVGVSLGALGGAVAFDQFAAKYLWPEPEDLAIRPRMPRFPSPSVEPATLHQTTAEAS